MTTNPSPDTSQPVVEGFVAHLRTLAEHRGKNARPELRWVWDGVESLVLGMAGEPVVLGSLRLPDGVEAGTVKECYFNAFNLSLTSPRYLYAEGYAYAGFFPVHHAWVVDTDSGAVVDPTWVSLDYEGPFIYLGLRFAKRFIGRLVEAEGRAPSVFEADWTRRHKTARCGLVLDEEGVVVDWGDPPPF